jgi:hypothetical protein
MIETALEAASRLLSIRAVGVNHSLGDGAEVNRAKTGSRRSALST